MENGHEMHPEQLRFAEVLHWCTVAGFVALVGAFAAYLLDWLPPHVPLSKLPQVWNLSAEAYLKATHTPTGWHWLMHMGHGDYASQLGIAILAGCCALCIAAIIPIYAKSRNKIYIAISALEIAVLAASAAGIFNR